MEYENLRLSAFEYVRDWGCQGAGLFRTLAAAFRGDGGAEFEDQSFVFNERKRDTDGAVELDAVFAKERTRTDDASTRRPARIKDLHQHGVRRISVRGREADRSR